ncbi:LysE family translocator [Hasllibacter sp. MH4015]|uniref:LysE family translocator n=1 Tax=Hasllibacter sp. MH4015 TaxID=2854029 RepID=UPI001CD77DDA|nr:LysE family transporter [Hasllibacter sp. MH4015]
MMDLGVLTALGTFLVAAGSPGPATLAVAGTAMALGRSAGLMMGAGLALGLASWGLAVGLGFGALVAQSPVFLTIFKLIGASYLLYLAWVTGRTAFRKDTAPDTVAEGRAFRRGLILNLGNPKAALAWIAALALSTDGTAPGWGIVVACAAMGFGIYAAYAFAFALPPVRSTYRRFRRWIDGVTAVLFALAGLRLLAWRGAE